ncbi:MAG: ABC transporter permease subunit [Fuerstiella sp.]|nr:ABC transporter permease subunit [Fuerstiella sp.]
MNAYLAILKDSFREAVASRVLLIALAGIVSILLLLAPFGLSTDKATELRRSEVRQPERLLTRLVNGAEEQNTPAAHLWSLLNDAQQKRARDLLNPESENRPRRRGGPGANPLKRQIVDQLNELLKADHFYDVDSWKDVRLPDEASNLLQQPGLSDSSLQRRNLLLLAAAFRREIDIADSNAISLGYANATVIGPIPLTPSQFEPIFDQIVVRVVGVFLGFLGVFGSLLVTAGLIPRTFEPGEIALLLSKPVHRSWLFVTKFLGGCIFTLLYASVLVTGIWLLLGIRMGSWQHQLLWCIPVYVFLFMVYYSVSAVAGAIWRNSIVALVLVVLFWTGLQVVGVTETALQDRLVNDRGIKEIAIVDTGILAVDGEQNTYIWNAESSHWQQTFEEPPDSMSGFARRFLATGVRFAPVYDSHSDRIYALQLAESRFGGFGPPQLVTGYAEDGWERVSLGRVPEVVTTVLIGKDGRVLLPSSQRIYQYVGQTEQQQRRADFLDNITGGILSGAGKAFKQVQPKDMPDLGENFAAAINPDDNQLLLFGNGHLHQLKALDDGSYSLIQSRDFDTDESAVMNVAGMHAVLALASGKIQVLNARSLETVHEQQLADGVVPRLCTAAPDGSSLAILTHAEDVFLFDGSTGRPITWHPPENGACSAVAYSPDGQLLVSNGRLAVRKYDVSTGQRSDEWSEQTTWVYDLYDYVIQPLWTVLPKPSQLDEFVTYIMSGKQSVLATGTPPWMANGDNLQQQRDTFEPVPVIRDNVIFLIAMLCVGCLYVARRDY